MDLPALWFWIIAFLFVGYFVLDGFDFGVGMSLPLLSRDETDRRVIVNAIGPVWDLNETWVIVAGAALFAAFPEWYATLFSGFYLPLLLILIALILRGVSFEYRHQRPDRPWTRRFDAMIVTGSVFPAFLWGVAFANVVQGVPLDANGDFAGTLADLLNPYALLGGIAVLLLFLAHGAMFLALKTEGELRERARRLSVRAGAVALLAAGPFLAWTLFAQGGVAVVLLATIAATALVLAVLCAYRMHEGWSFALMATTIATAVLTLFASLYPDVMPASNDPALSLTIHTASSSDYTLGVMSWIALASLPVIAGYQAWTYWTFRKRLSRSHIEASAVSEH